MQASGLEVLPWKPGLVRAVLVEKSRQWGGRIADVAAYAWRSVRADMYCRDQLANRRQCEKYQTTRSAVPITGNWVYPSVYPSGS